MSGTVSSIDDWNGILDRRQPPSVTSCLGFGPGDVFEKRNIRLVHDSGLLHYSLQVI